MRRLAAAVAIVAAACVRVPPRVAPPSEIAAAVAPLNEVAPGDALVVAAGDIVDCNHLEAARATAAIVAALPRATVLTLGDNVYPNGSAEQFARCYDPTWGAFKVRTRPSPGNHEGRTANSAGYFGYFGVPPFYSFDLGGWHLVSLDSSEDLGAGSRQIAWLTHDLDAMSKPCILAYWHHPRFSSGVHGRQPNDPGRRMGALWSVLAAHGATLVLNGHDHEYERFAPRDGIREIVVGTGGGTLRPFVGHEGGSEARVAKQFGVLAVTLHPRGYEWRFVGVDGKIGDASERIEPCTRRAP